MPQQALPRQVFLSHTRKDEPLANELKKALRKRGLTVWDDRAIPAGADWDKEIEKALNSSDSMIAILTTNSFSSAWVRNELEHALFSERFKGRFLPVLIGEKEEPDFSRLPWVLSKLQYLQVNERKSSEEITSAITDAFFQLLTSQSST